MWTYGSEIPHCSQYLESKKSPRQTYGGECKRKKEDADECEQLDVFP